MPSLFSVLSLVCLSYVSVVVITSTYRHMRFGNAQVPHPFPFRYALGMGVAEALLTPPLAQHRARMKAMRQAEARRTRAVAQAMTRHPAAHVIRATETTPARQAESLPASSEEFVARARATHVSDQVVASIRAAKDRHPSVAATSRGVVNAAGATVG